MVLMPLSRDKFKSILLFTGEHIYTDVNGQEPESYINVCNNCATKLIKSTAKTFGLIITSFHIESENPNANTDSISIQ